MTVYENSRHQLRLSIVLRQCAKRHLLADDDARPVLVEFLLELIQADTDLRLSLAVEFLLHSPASHWVGKRDLRHPAVIALLVSIEESGSWLHFPSQIGCGHISGHIKMT